MKNTAQTPAEHTPALFGQTPLVQGQCNDVDQRRYLYHGSNIAPVITCRNADEAAYVLRAVNSHAALVAALASAKS
jgi:hypothetical protein